MKKSKIKTNLLTFLIIFAVAFVSSVLTQVLMNVWIDWITSAIISLGITAALIIFDVLNITKKFKKKKK